MAATTTGKTKGEEDASRWIIEQALVNDKYWPDINSFLNDKSKPLTKLAAIYPAVKNQKDTSAQEWLESFLAQHKTMHEKFANRSWKSFNVIDRDSAGGFMSWITKAVRLCYGISQKDTWDPADIWCVRNYETVKKELEKILGKESDWGKKNSPGSIYDLNKKLQDLYRNSTAKIGPAVAGISLKKISPVMINDPANPKKKKKVFIAHFEEVNLDNSLFKTKEFKLGYRVSQIYIDFIVQKVKRKEKGASTQMEIMSCTQDSRVIVVNTYAKGDEYNFQIKPIDTRMVGNLKYEATKKGAGAAKLGKAPVELMAKAFRDHDVNFTNNHSGYPKTLDAYNARSNEYKTMWTSLKNCKEPFASIIDKSVLGKTVDEFDLAVRHMFTPNTKKSPIPGIGKGAGEPQNAVSKLMQLTLIYEMFKMITRKENSKKGTGIQDLNNIWTDASFFSQKKNRYATDKFGPFGKLY